jgi:hypothetical protein
LVKAKKTLLKGSNKSTPPKTEQEQRVKFLQDLDERREKIALTRLGLENLFDPKWYMNKGNTEYNLFESKRLHIIYNSQEPIHFLRDDLFKPKFRGKVKLYKNELSLYGHMVYNDYKTFPSQILKNMLSNFKSAHESISKATHDIVQHTIHKSRTKQEVKEKYKFGLGLGLPNQFNTIVYEELNTIQKQLTALGMVIMKDQKYKSPITSTPFKAKMQYFLFLTRELYNMLDWSQAKTTKTTNLTEEEIHKQVETFTLNIMDSFYQIQDTDEKILINSFEWNLTSTEKKKIKIIKQFQNLMGCSNEAQFLKIKKAINF